MYLSILKKEITCKYIFPKSCPLEKNIKILKKEVDGTVTYLQTNTG